MWLKLLTDHAISPSLTKGVARFVNALIRLADASQYACIEGEDGLWCSLTKNYDEDKKRGSCLIKALKPISEQAMEQHKNATEDTSRSRCDHIIIALPLI